jgi:hypothetical protein
MFSQYLPTYIGSCQGKCEVDLGSSRVLLAILYFWVQPRFSFASDNFQKKFHTKKYKSPKHDVVVVDFVTLELSQNNLLLSQKEFH